MTSLLHINYFRYRPPASDCIYGKDEKQVIDLDECFLALCKLQSVIIL